MFRARELSSPPKAQNTKMSPLIELRECVSRMNTLKFNICRSLHNAHAGRSPSASPTKRPTSPGGSVSPRYKGGDYDRRNAGMGGISTLSEFVSIHPKEEGEMIELLRRIAELVVQGEQRAAASDDSTAPNQQLQDGNGAVFEYFCEANVLGNIVDIVTGQAFLSNGGSDENIARKASKDLSDLKANSSHDNGNGSVNVNGSDEEDKTTSNESESVYHFLPPISIATQAIQSVSILVQNVAKVTSLYYILSNNIVNDLINLPLEQYSHAEYYQNTKKRLTIPTRKSQSAEMSELATLFISFLKSLVMRMNPETLQFYLTYPAQNTNDIDFSTIQFPLYARALEFCNPEEDNFVRVTAMNICLNTLRLATNGDPLQMGESQSIQQSIDAATSATYNGHIHKNSNNQSNGNSNKSRPDQISSPDGSSLHKTKALPFKERLAISHFVCQPSRVEALTKATFTKIGQLCSSLEDTIRNMDRIDWTLSQAKAEAKAKASSDSKSTKNKDMEKTEKELQVDRIRCVKQFLDFAADFQDEIYLLEDVLAVGLVPLNEQIIEMMFAGVVYPMVLQPLNPDNQTKKNQVADIAQAKAAFFVIGSIYHYISHKPFLYLLLTALFHPFTPEPSTSPVQTDTPAVAQMCNDGNVQIKTDQLLNGNSLNCYLFGRKGQDVDMDEMKGTKLLSEYTYVLSPAYAQLYDAETMSQTLRKNSYRRSFLACLSGTDGMSVLQPLAIYAMDAVLATIKPEVLKNVMFGANILPEWEINSNRNDNDSVNTSNSNKSEAENYMLEIVASICRSVMIATETPRGVWNLNFNLVASHAICCAILIDKTAKSTALKLVEQRRRDAASFISQTPIRLNYNLAQNQNEYKIGSKSSLDEDLRMDRIFFDPFCDGDKFAVENIIRKQNGNFISVAKDGRMDDFCKLICKDPSTVRDFKTEEASYRCAANSAVAYLELDAFTKLLKDNFDTAALQKQKGYLGVEAFARFNKNCDEGKKNTDRVLLSRLPPPFSSLLIDEGSFSSVSSDTPKTGAVVQLVGKTAFPCVCEVTKESSSLFTDGEASVVADGIKWQSLWMVLMGKYMILAEPVKKDSGGNGRVVTSYPLCCITAEKDESADILQSASPARRLLLTHISPDITPPGLFTIDSTDRDQLVNNDEVQITRSVMDLWFEDSNAATKALKTLHSKIVKARSRRGQSIREALVQDDRLRFQSFLNG